MTTERARQEWEYFERQVLPAYIDRLNNLEEQKTDLDLKKKEIIQEIAEKVEDAGWVPHDQISAYLKKVLKGIVKTDTIEDALGKRHKRKWASPIVGKPESPVSERERSQSVLPNKEIEVSSDGYSTPPEPEDDPESNQYEYEKEDISQSVKEEIAMFEKEREELQIRLTDALKLADDKDRALERERLKFADLEVELGNMKANAPPSKSVKDVDANEELQIKYDELKAAYNELLEVERLRTSKSDFQSAATLPKQVWLSAIDALNFYSVLNKASRWAIEHNDPWKKILFDIKEDGQLKAANLEQ